MKLVIAEKPSVAQSLAKVIGANKRQDGYLEGGGYLVSWCVGHLVELSAPERYDECYAKWRLEDLPILPEKWLYEVSSGTKKQYQILKKLMERPDVEKPKIILRYQITGKKQHSDVIAYQIRQSFKPGEITAEEANRIGYELALRFTKGKYSFIVATHTDRAHIHNHVVFNSTSIDGFRKFKDFWRSGLALQKLSDLICLEHDLSVIDRKPYDEREKRTRYPVKEGIRGGICRDIDEVLSKKPKDFEAFLDGLKESGYEIRTGKNIAVKGRNQQRYIRLSSLPEGFRESDIRMVLSGAAEHQPYTSKAPVQYR